jgi:hypothetical protein
MSDSHVKTPIWFWILAVIGLLWFAMGAWDYSATQLRFEWYLASFTEEQIAYFYSFPTWYVAVWALSVWGAFIGAVLLLLRMKLASLAFLISLITYIIGAIYSFGFTEWYAMMGMFGLVFSIIIFLSLLGFFWMARSASSSGILR